jgi:GAF domain-containing protein
MTPDGGGTPGTLPPAVLRWADELVERLAGEPLFQHTAVFVGAPGWDALVLAAQRWGPIRDTGDVRVGSWVVPISGSVCGRVFRSGKPALVGDIRLDPDYRGFPGGQSRSELAVPILAGGLVVGVVNLESPQVGGFTIADLDRVQALADRAAIDFADAGLGDLLGPSAGP